MAKFKNIPYGLTIGAGQSIRRNEADTLFEAYTPNIERVLSDFYTDAVSTTAEADLYVSTIPANTLANDGDKLLAVFGGDFETGVDLKYLYVYFAGTKIFDAEDIAQSGGAWRLNVLIIRVDASTCRTSIALSSVDRADAHYNTLTTKDFTIENDLQLRGFSDVAGDVTARLGYVKFIPAAIVEEAGTFNLLFGGDRLVFGGDPLTFNP